MLLYYINKADKWYDMPTSPLKGILVLSKVESAWTVIFGPKWCTICHKRQYTKTWHYCIKVQLINGLNEMKSV